MCTKNHPNTQPQGLQSRKLQSLNEENSVARKQLIFTSPVLHLSFNFLEP